MKSTNRLAFIFTLVTLLIALSFSNTPYTQAAESSLHIVDSNATKNTKALFSYLQSVSGEHILFGQQHVTDEGLTLTNNPPRVASEQSDIFHSTGDYPALFGWDTLSISGDEKPGVKGDLEQSITNLAASMKKVHELGGILTLSMHPDNFATGGRYNDTSGNTVATILPGGENNEKLNAYLDNIASLATQLKDDSGESIPFIFRPFHEQTGGWFWWGAHQTTPEQYKALFRYTVEYLRDTKDVHNILYGFSPGAGPAGDLDRYLATYPGDAYVDIFGIDNYDNKANAGSAAWLNGLVTDLAMLVDLAEERGKIAALTEFGYSAQGMNQTGNTLDWYTKVLDAIKADPKAKKIAYMQTWANFGWPNNMFVPYKDIHGDLGGDHELLPDFIHFKDDAYTAFRNDISNNIFIPTHQNSTTTKPEPIAHIASPVSGTTIVSDETTIRLRVLNDTPTKVSYTVEGSDSEYELTRNEATNYYEGTFRPLASMNGSSTNLTFKVEYSNGDTYTEDVKLFIKASELAYRTYTFDDSISDIKSNGTYPEATIQEFVHKSLDGDGKLHIKVADMPTDETWQEIKLELLNLTNEDVQQINQVSFDVLLPSTVGDGTIQAIAMLPDDWDTKYGMNETAKQTSELEEVTIGGETFKKYHVTIPFTPSDNSRTVALSIVGSKLQLNGDLYVDNIVLKSTFTEAPANPLLVDNFEDYFGDDSLLNNQYSSNGDKVILSHSTENMNEGQYGLSYTFTIANLGYAGRQMALNNVDWSETNGIEFWLKHDSYPNELTIQIQIGGVSFEAYRELKDAHDGVVKIPFSEFKPAPWEGKPNVVIDKEKLQAVKQFAIYTGGEKGTGTLYFDNFRAIYDENLGEVPDSSVVPDEERNQILFDFEDGELNWLFLGNGTEPTITTDGINGSSLQTTIDLSKGDPLTLYTTSISDLSEEDIVSAKIKLQTGAAIVKFFIKTGDDWTWHDGGEIELQAGGVQTVQLDLTKIENLDNVREFGFEFIPLSEEGSSVILVDDITLTDGVVPDDNNDDQSGEETGNDNQNGDKPSDDNQNTGQPGDDNQTEEKPSDDAQNTNQSSDDNESDEDENLTNDNESSTENNEEQLPNTATSMYNFLFIGFVSLLLGCIAIYLIRRNRITHDN